MSDSEDTQLEARLAEQDSFEPPESFVEQANVSDPEIYAEFEENWPDCWERAADLLEWESDYDEVLVDDDEPFYEWFTGGELNASANCLDRHLEDRGDETAIQWEGELGESREYTYEELHREVNETAAALRDLGVEEDDVVTMYMPMIPELPVAMLACARIGAPHSVVFAGFSADALATRMESADSEYLITCDGYYRRGDPLDHLEKTNEGLADVAHDTTTVVVDRLGDDLDHELADDQLDYNDLVASHEGASVEPVTRDAEDMLFLMYTSGTTGKPKGVKHTTGGYLSYAAWTSHAVLDVKPEDTYWCSADIGWITGHSYIVYGPLALGTTTVMYEGTPDYPDKDRMWDIVDSYDVNQLYTAPTAIRAFMKWGSQYPEQHDLSSLRLLGTVGEPINPKAWKWYYKHIGGESCPIVDTWWQTETGGGQQALARHAADAVQKRRAVRLGVLGGVLGSRFGRVDLRAGRRREDRRGRLRHDPRPRRRRDPDRRRHDRDDGDRVGGRRRRGRRRGRRHECGQRPHRLRQHRTGAHGRRRPPERRRGGDRAGDRRRGASRPRRLHPRTPEDPLGEDHATPAGGDRDR